MARRQSVAIFALVIAATVSLMAPAASHAVIAGDWGRHSVLASRFHVPLPTAYVHTAECPYAPGHPCAGLETREAWVPHGSDRFTLAHELGHLYDEQTLTDTGREWFRTAMRAPAGGWWKEWGAAEWFADFYALCALGYDLRRINSAPGGYISHPSRQRLSRVCNRIRSTATR